MYPTHVRSQVDIELDIFGDHRPQHGDRVTDQSVEVDGAVADRLAAAERQELPHECRAALASLENLLDGILSRVIKIHLLLQDLRISGDRQQQVVEVVRQPTGQLAEGFHLVGLTQLLFEPLALRRFADEADDRYLVLDMYRKRDDLDGDESAILVPQTELVRPGVLAAKVSCQQQGGGRQLFGRQKLEVQKAMTHELVLRIADQLHGGRIAVYKDTLGIVEVHGIRRVLEEDPEALAVGDQPLELGYPVTQAPEFPGALIRCLGVVDHHSVLAGSEPPDPGPATV